MALNAKNAETAEQIWKFWVSGNPHNFPECLWPICGYLRPLGGSPQPFFVAKKCCHLATRMCTLASQSARPHILLQTPFHGINSYPQD